MHLKSYFQPPPTFPTWIVEHPIYWQQMFMAQIKKCWSDCSSMIIDRVTLLWISVTLWLGQPVQESRVTFFWRGHDLKAVCFQYNFLNWVDSLAFTAVWPNIDLELPIWLGKTAYHAQNTLVSLTYIDCTAHGVSHSRGNIRHSISGLHCFRQQ